MASEGTIVLANVLKNADAKVVDAWFALLRTSGALQSGRIREAELQTQVRSIYAMLVAVLETGKSAVNDEAFAPLREA